MFPVRRQTIHKLCSTVRVDVVRCQKSEGLTEEDAARALSLLGDKGPTARLTDAVVARVEADRRVRRAEEEEEDG